MPQSIPSPEAEAWRPVVGYEGVYSVSSLGRVRRDAGGRGARAGYVLRSTLMKTGYLRVGLVRDGKQETRTVHSLVADAFLGPRLPGMTVNHRDGDKANPALSNLEYVTYGENNSHALRLGLRVAKWNGYVPEALKGEANPCSLVSEVDVRAIRASSESPGVLGARYGISRSAVRAIRERKTWKHVP